MSTKLTHNEYLGKLNNVNPTIHPLEEYVDSHTPILHKCLICGNEWKIAPSNATHRRNGNGCPKCQNMKISERSKKPLDVYLNELKMVNPFLEYISGYVDAKTKCKHKCTVCGNEFFIDPSHVLIGNGCSKCATARVADLCRKSHEQFMTQVKPVLNDNIKIIGKYRTSKEPIECECVKCGQTIMKLPSELLKGTGCQNCSAKELGKAKRKSHEQFVLDLSKVNSRIELLSDYEGAHTKVLCRCRNNPEHEWSAYPNNLLKGAGCPKCADVIGGEKRKQATLKKYLPIFKKNNLELIGEYKGTYEDTLFKCLVCGIEFDAAPHKIVQGQKGCPCCTADSAGERKIFQFLYNQGIRYIPEMSFDGLVGWGNGPLRYDFYLPDYNTLIEYHGSQHESPKYGYFGGDEEFEKRHAHDQMKVEYAEKNGYKLITIWYYDYDNIEEILKQSLNLETVETVITA